MFKMMINVFDWMGGDWRLVGRISKNKLSEECGLLVEDLEMNGFVRLYDNEGLEERMYMDVEYERWVDKELGLKRAGGEFWWWYRE